MKRFKVVSLSSTTNSFGLRGHIFIGDDGTAWEAAANSLNSRPLGAVLTFEDNQPFNYGIVNYGFELPRQLPTPPHPVVDEAWPAGEQVPTDLPA